MPGGSRRPQNRIAVAYPWGDVETSTLELQLSPNLSGKSLTAFGALGMPQHRTVDRAIRHIAYSRRDT